jgi:hypothetical protein
MRDTIKVTPTLIRRIRAAEDRIEMASVPTKDGEGRALLVFMNEAQAEAFRSETGAYPASEGSRSPRRMWRRWWRRGRVRVHRSSTASW